MNDKLNKTAHDEHDHEEFECLEAIDSLYAYLDGELTDETTLRKFKEHLKHCNSCYTRSELEGVISERIRVTGKEKAPDSLKERLFNIIDDC